jgi:hypothetical protein
VTIFHQEIRGIVADGRQRMREKLSILFLVKLALL